MGDVGMILLLSLLAQEVSFLRKQVSSHLDVICLLKSASKAKLSNLPNFDHQAFVNDFSQMAFPNQLKLFPLDNRIFKISLDSRIIKLGPETGELGLIQFDPAAVIRC